MIRTSDPACKRARGIYEAVMALTDKLDRNDIQGDKRIKLVVIAGNDFAA
jgi:hypothetical protein